MAGAWVDRGTAGVPTVPGTGTGAERRAGAVAVAIAVAVFDGARAGAEARAETGMAVVGPTTFELVVARAAAAAAAKDTALTTGRSDWW